MTTSKPEEAMTDRGLLELAAKAGGIELTGRTYGELYETADQEKRWWNPLTDDGDALRLAVDLRIDVYPWISEEDPTSSAMARNGHGFRAIEFASKNRGCRYAATRRAIVRAAAEAGRARP